VHLIHGLKEGSGETGSFRNARTPDSAVTIGNVRALVHPEDWDHLREAWWHASFIARVVRCKSLDPTSLIGIGDQTTYVDMSESYTGADFKLQASSSKRRRRRPISSDLTN
jgi:hypothetical protein